MASNINRSENSGLQNSANPDIPKNLEKITVSPEDPFSKTKNILNELKTKLAEKETKKQIEPIHTRDEIAKIAQVSRNILQRNQSTL